MPEKRQQGEWNRGWRGRESRTELWRWRVSERCKDLTYPLFYYLSMWYVYARYTSLETFYVAPRETPFNRALVVIIIKHSQSNGLTHTISDSVHIAKRRGGEGISIIRCIHTIPFNLSHFFKLAFNRSGTRTTKNHCWLDYFSLYISQMGEKKHVCEVLKCDCFACIEVQKKKKTERFQIVGR